MFTRYDDFEIHIRDSEDKGYLLIDIEGRPLIADLGEPVRTLLDPPPPGWRQVIETQDPNIAELGNTLYKTVFGQIEKYWGAYMSRQRQGKGVRICIAAQSSTLSSAIWELLCDPLKPTPKFLALDPSTPIVRLVKSDFVGPIYLSPKLPLRMLVILASPFLQNINATLEKENLVQALKGAVKNSLVHVDYVGFDNPGEANFDELQKRVAAADPPYDIVHIISHGLFEENREGLLALVDPETGQPQEVLASRLKAIFASRYITLVVLQSCQAGAADPSARYFGNVAQQLVANGLPAVLAMQGDVDQDVAREFMEALYLRWLDTGCAFEDALTQARQRIYQQFSDRITSWAIPVLYIYPAVQVKVRRKSRQPHVPEPMAFVQPSHTSPPAAPVREEPTVVTARKLDAALPNQARLGKPTQLLVLIRLPDSSGLRELLDAQPQDYDARPKDVRTSPTFDVTFPRDQATGEFRAAKVRVAIETSDFDLADLVQIVQLRPQGDDVYCPFYLTPKHEGVATLLVRVLDVHDSEPDLATTLATVGLTTTIRTGAAFEASYQVVSAEPEQAEPTIEDASSELPMPVTARDLYHSLPQRALPGVDRRASSSLERWATSEAEYREEREVIPRSIDRGEIRERVGDVHEAEDQEREDRERVRRETEPKPIPQGRYMPPASRAEHPATTALPSDADREGYTSPQAGTNLDSGEGYTVGLGEVYSPTPTGMDYQPLASRAYSRNLLVIAILLLALILVVTLILLLWPH